MGCYFHELPGRIRIKIPQLRRNSEALAKVDKHLRAERGVRSTYVNTLTGGIVVNFDPNALHSDTILSIIEREAGLPRLKILRSEQYVDRALREASQSVASMALGLFLNRVLQGSSLEILGVII